MKVGLIMLFETSDEAEQYCIDKLQNKNNEEELKEIIEVAKLYKLQVLEGEANKLLGDQYFRKKCFDFAGICYSNSLKLVEGTNKQNLIPYLYNRLGSCRYFELKYNEALKFFDKANVYAIIYNDEIIEVDSLFNIALSYKRLNWLDRAIEYIDIFIEKMKERGTSEDLIHANMFKANCYALKKDFRRVIEVYKNIIDELHDKYALIAGQIYNNIGSAYLDLGDLANSLEYYNQSEIIRREKDIAKLSRTLINKAQVYIKLKLYDDAETAISEGIENAKIYNDIEYVLLGYRHLIILYSELEDYDNVVSVYSKIIELLKEKDSSELQKVYLELADIYIKLGKLDKANEFMKLDNE